MWLLGLEACVAMFILVFIVWWTMFQGNKPPTKKSEKPESKDDEPSAP